MFVYIIYIHDKVNFNHKIFSIESVNQKIVLHGGVTFLCSEEANYITGETITMDGSLLEYKETNYEHLLL